MRLKTQKRKRGALIVGVGIFFCLFPLVFVVTRYLLNKNPVDTGSIFEEASRIVQMPDTEKPQFIRIDDAENYSKHKVFKDAKEGDVFIIFVGAKVGFLYRPNTHQLVTKVPLYLESEVSSTLSSIPGLGER